MSARGRSPSRDDSAGHESDGATAQRRAPDASADTDADTPTVSDWLRPRAHLFATAFLAGAVGGVLALAGLTLWTGDARGSESTAFALGALGLGFGVLGWSGSVVAGRSIETMQRHAGTATGWMERDSRRAMARIAGFGAGIMTGVSLLAAVL